MFKDTNLGKRVTRSRKSKHGRQNNGKKKTDTATNNAGRTLYRKLMIGQHEPHQRKGKQFRNGKVVPSPLVLPVVLSVIDKNIIWYGNRKLDNIIRQYIDST